MYEFDCGCKLPQFGTDLKDCDSLPSLWIDYYNLPDCPMIWDMFCSGNTKGVFQLETHTGKGISKKLAPRNIDELAALIALMRPGSANSIVDGKSMTQHYIDRKHGTEEVKSIHTELDDILYDTFQVLVFQEQSINIAIKIAGFSPTEADALRKSIGTKDPALMSTVEQLFIAGCRKVGLVNDIEAQNIFNMIRESQKYSFNAAHSYEYAELGIWTMWPKLHLPIHFFASWLYHAEEKMKPKLEIAQLVNNAKQMGIDIYPPQLSTVFYGDYGQFAMSKKGVHFGINNVKGIGINHTNKFIEHIKNIERATNKEITKFTWEEFLVLVADETTKTVMNNLIMVGFFNHLRQDRRKLLYDYNIWSEINDREKQWFKKQNLTNSTLKGLLDGYKSESKQHGGPFNDKRRAKISELYDILVSPPYPLEDTPLEIATSESELLGTTLTCTKRDSVNPVNGNCTCQEYLGGKTGKLVLVVEIISILRNNIKRGKNAGRKMATLTIEDQTGILDNVMCFSDTYDNYRHELYEGNVVIIEGYKSKTDGNLIISSIKNT